MNSSLLSFVVIVAKDRSKPALSLIHLLTLPAGIVLDLILANLLHGEVVSVRICKVEAADGASWSHSKRLGELDSCLLSDLHEVPHGGLLSVIRLRGVARSWSDALVLDIDALGWS